MNKVKEHQLILRCYPGDMCKKDIYTDNSKAIYRMYRNFICQGPQLVFRLLSVEQTPLYNKDLKRPKVMKFS